MHSWTLTGSLTVTYRLYCISDICVLQTQGLRETERVRESFCREGTRDCWRKEGGREKRVRRIAEWKAVLTVDCLFGNENEHPEALNLRFEMSH